MKKKLHEKNFFKLSFTAVGYYYQTLACPNNPTERQALPLTGDDISVSAPRALLEKSLLKALLEHPILLPMPSVTPARGPKSLLCWCRGFLTYRLSLAVTSLCEQASLPQRLIVHSKEGYFGLVSPSWLGVWLRGR